jgi:hypothetical protein
MESKSKFEFEDCSDTWWITLQDHLIASPALSVSSLTSVLESVSPATLDRYSVLPFGTICNDLHADKYQGSSPVAEKQPEEKASLPATLPIQRVPREIQVKRTAPSAPLVDKEYFSKGYKENLVVYWKPPFDKPTVINYLTENPNDMGRGAPYRNYAHTLYKLQQEFLSPEEFLNYEGTLFRWELMNGVKSGRFKGMKHLLETLGDDIVEKDDSVFPVGTKMMMYLKGDGDDEWQPPGHPWFFIAKSTIDKAGNGLFAAREFEKGQIIGFYVGYLIFRYPKKWTAVATDEYISYMGGRLEDDSRSMTLIDKTGYRVVVNPHHTKGKERIDVPPLFMGIHFLNDFTKILNLQGRGGSLNQRCQKMNNVWVDDQGGVRASKRIVRGEELLLSYEGKRPLPKTGKGSEVTPSRNHGPGLCRPDSSSASTPSTRPSGSGTKRRKS